MKEPLFRGCATAIVTPFTRDARSVDYALYEELVARQLLYGADALVVAGTTGESPVLSREEKKNLFSISVSMADGRIPVIAGTGSNDTEQAVRKSNDAEKEGVDGLLIVTPFYNKCTQEGLVRHYHYIADRVSAPVIVYNVPSRTGVNVLPETYLAITSHPRIVGIKEANGDISAAAKTISLCGHQAAFYSGNDDQTVPLASIGGDGVISVVSNLIPREMRALTHSALHHHFPVAQSLQREYAKLTALMFREVNPIPVKAALAVMKNRPFPLRLPLTNASRETVCAIRRELRRLKLAEDAPAPGIRDAKNFS